MWPFPFFHPGASIWFYVFGRVRYVEGNGELFTRNDSFFEEEEEIEREKESENPSEEAARPAGF